MLPGYPKVLTEAETVTRLLEGWSLARFGDGELAIAAGGANSTHACNSALAAEMRRVLLSPSKRVLPAIIPLREGVIRVDDLTHRCSRWLHLFDPKRVYGSSFVGRPKNAPWTAEPEHLRRYRSVWHGKKIALICPEDHMLRSILRADVVLCPHREAYSESDRLVESALRLRPEVVILCAGPAATVMAARIAEAGVQAIDLGRGAGAIYKNLEQGE